MAPCPWPLSTAFGPPGDARPRPSPGRQECGGRGLGWGWGRPFSRPGPLRLTQLEFKCWPLLSPEWPGVSATLGPGPGLRWSSSQPSRPAPGSPEGLFLAHSSRQPSWTPLALSTCPPAPVLSVLGVGGVGSPPGLGPDGGIYSPWGDSPMDCLLPDWPSLASSWTLFQERQAQGRGWRCAGSCPQLEQLSEHKPPSGRHPDDSHGCPKLWVCRVGHPGLGLCGGRHVGAPNSRISDPPAASLLQAKVVSWFKLGRTLGRYTVKASIWVVEAHTSPQAGLPLPSARPGAANPVSLPDTPVCSLSRPPAPVEPYG